MSGFNHQYSNHICGCYYMVAFKRRYLPQVISESHTTISPISFATQLRQTYSNTSRENLPKVRYTFPLYDGVVVSGYTIAYAGKTLKGVVKQKDVAKQIYQEAVDRGDTAGLLEALPAGVFGVTLGNIPPGQDITVTIDYCGELKHDSQIDGLRFTLPTSIAPRYGSYPGQVLDSNVATKGGISIIVDINMLDSPIRKVQSPSHPLSVTMGELANAEAGTTAAFSSSQASATLTLGSAELAEDFVLQILVSDIGNPKAVIETHSTLSNHRAIMTTLVPKFTLEQAKPEIVFIADQSGSMAGAKNQALVAALKIFLKSLPVGVRFNICAFGSSFEFLWPKSVAYSEENLNTAMEFVNDLDASLGGTELLEPIQQTFKRQLKDLSLEVMLLTDGQIWGESQVFDFINEQIRDKGVDARVFALGIGQEVSHTLVEGIARAGNGFAQFTQTESEDVDQKIIRMLKGALYAHTRDYTLEVHYEEPDSTSDENDFEIIDKVNDFLTVREQPRPEGDNKAASKTKSFFDTSANLDKKIEESGRYAHLPYLQTPAIIQAPASIPPLFPFNRTNVYLLLGPDSPQKAVSSITLRATSSEGPLELNVPVTSSAPGTSIHQLAARKAIQDLEEGRGWLQSATVKDLVADQKVLVKEKYEGRFDEIVEQEAVQLGETFSVAGKFTSFVAVSDSTSEATEDIVPESDPESGHDFLRKVSAPGGGGGMMRMRRSGGPLFASAMPAPPPPSMDRGGAMMMVGQSQAASVQRMAPQISAPSPKSSFGATKLSGLFRSAPSPGTCFGATSSSGLFGAGPSPPKAAVTQPAGSAIHQIISLQTFAGAWTWGDELLRLVGKTESQVDVAKLGNDKTVAATVLAIAFMEKTLRARKDVWEFVVEKGRSWLSKQMGGDVARVEELIRAAAEDFSSS